MPRALAVVRPEMPPELRMLKSRRSRLRKRGHPTDMVGVRYPVEQLEKIDVVGHTRTDGAVRLVDIALDAATEMGDAWIDVIRLAERDDLYEGQALGRLAKLGVEVEREREKKARK